MPGFEGTWELHEAGTGRIPPLSLLHCWTWTGTPPAVPRWEHSSSIPQASGVLMPFLYIFFVCWKECGGDLGGWRCLGSEHTAPSRS